MPLDPAVKQWLDIMNSAMPKIGSMPAAEMRSLMAAAQKAAPPGPAIHYVADGTLPGPGGDIPYRLYRPSDEPVALVVFYHGGGWTLGSLDGYDTALRKLANASGAAVISIDYRLAPEHPFPAAVDDAISAFRWAAQHTEELAGHIVPLIVAGDSAGGNLTAVVTQAMRDENGPAIAGQILIYPAVDGNIDSPQLKAFEAPFLTLDDIRWFYGQYTPDASVRSDKRLSPAYASRFDRLPPAFVLTAEMDLLHAEGEDYAQKLENGGVPVEVKRYGGTFHGFVTLDGGLPHSVEATEDMARFIRSVASEPN